MKRQTLLAWFAIAALGVATAQDAAPEQKQNQPAEPVPAKTEDASKPQPPRPERPRIPRPSPPPERLITPEVSIKKAEHTIKEILDRYDKNANGRLDAGEKKQFLQDMEDAEKIYRLSHNYKYNLKVIDADGDLKISDEEKALAEQRLKEARRANIRSHRPEPGEMGRPPKFHRAPGRVPPPPPRPQPASETQPEQAPAEK